MGYKIAVFAFFVTLFACAVYSLSPSQCAVYNSEAGCNDNGCFWCDGCVNNKLGNNYGGDKCVQSSLNCTYSCSMQCGAQCVTNSDCRGNITGNTCYYGGVCNGCSCNYRQQDCPKPGTVKDAEYAYESGRLCYYNTRYCGTNGCSVQSCALGDGDICDPDNGCINTGGQNEYLEDYICKGNELHAKLVSYFCNSTDCFYSKNDTLVDRCTNGCNNGKCNEAYCNIYGVNTLCSQQNAFYGDRFCIGNDIYQTYHNYSCGTNECVFSEQARKIADCDTQMTPSASADSCQSGRCVDPGQVIYVNYSYPTYSQPPASVANTTLQPIYHTGGRVFNGLLFGSNEIRIPIKGGGHMNFTVKQTNYLGALVVQVDNLIIMEGMRAPGTYDVPFSGKTIRIYARSSGWIFFTPTVYDIRAITVTFGE